jgi:hypothetical protein
MYHAENPEGGNRAQAMISAGTHKKDLAGVFDDPSADGFHLDGFEGQE